MLRRISKAAFDASIAATDVSDGMLIPSEWIYSAFGALGLAIITLVGGYKVIYKDAIASLKDLREYIKKLQKEKHAVELENVKLKSDLTLLQHKYDTVKSQPGCVDDN